MLTYDRKYHFIGELTLRKSRNLLENAQPADDPVNWLFLNACSHQFGFVYKIDKKQIVKYGEPFRVECAFTMIDAVQENVKVRQTYKVLRGVEDIGTLKVIKELV